MTEKQDIERRIKYARGDQRYWARLYWRESSPCRRRRWLWEFRRALVREWQARATLPEVGPQP